MVCGKKSLSNQLGEWLELPRPDCTERRQAKQSPEQIDETVPDAVNNTQNKRQNQTHCKQWSNQFNSYHV